MELQIGVMEGRGCDGGAWGEGREGERVAGRGGAGEGGEGDRTRHFHNTDLHALFLFVFIYLSVAFSLGLALVFLPVFHSGFWVCISLLNRFALAFTGRVYLYIIR